MIEIKDNQSQGKGLQEIAVIFGLLIEIQENNLMPKLQSILQNLL